MSRVTLVLGASGYTGRQVIRRLAIRGQAVRAFIRRPEAEADVRAAGAEEVVIGDLLDLPAVEAAVRGTDGIFFIGPRFMPEEVEVGKAVVDFAIRHEVPRFVFSGVYHPTIQALVNHQTKREIEDKLYASPLEFTVLQPARFMHGMLLPSWKSIAEDGILVDAFAPQARMAYVDYRDVAEVAAIAFTEDRLVRGTFELASPGEWTTADIAASCAAELGREVRVERKPLEQYGQAGTLLANPYAAAGFRRLRDYYDAHGFRGGNGLVLEAILGREPAGFADCVRHVREIETVSP